MSVNLEKLRQLQCTEESFKKFDINVKDKQQLIRLVEETMCNRSRQAKSIKEKFETLDLRDKVLKLVRYELANYLSTLEVVTIDLNVISGTCMDMCPEKERYSRENLSLCSKYETQDGKEVIDHRIMIKEYSRSSADQDLPLANEMRPPDVLYETMSYLINEIIPDIVYLNDQDHRDEFNPSDWYDFVWNRTRSIRKDIIQQRLLLINNQNHSDYSLAGVSIIEQCARFHIMCAYMLSQQSSEVFDFKINEENLKNCFQSLRQFYEFTTNKSIESSSVYDLSSPNEAEFRSYSILLNLKESNILSEIQRWPEHIRHSKQVKFALKAYFAFNSSNYIRFFRLVQSDDCEYLQSCILHRFFYEIRRKAFRIIFGAYRDKSQGAKERLFSLEKLVETLGFDSFEDATDYCNAFDLVMDDSHVYMPTSNTFSCFDLTEKSLVDKLRFERARLLVDSKFNEMICREINIDNINQINVLRRRLISKKCISKVVKGIELSYLADLRYNSENHELQSSFDYDGVFCSQEEINNMLDLADKAGLFSQTGVKAIRKAVATEAAKPKLPLKKAARLNQEEPLNENAETASVNKAIVLKKASKVHTVKAKHDVVDAEGRPLPSGTKERRRSSSSTGSTGANSKKQQKFEGEKREPTFQVETKPLFSNLQQSQAANPFSQIVSKPSAPSLFAQQQQSASATATTTTFNQQFKPASSFPLITATTMNSTTTNLFSRSAFPTQSNGPNLFENLLMKKTQEEEPQEQQQTTKLPDLASQKSKYIDQALENYWNSLLIQQCKSIAENFIFLNKTLPNELMELFIESTLGSVINEEFFAISVKRSLVQVILTELVDELIKRTCFDFLNELKDQATYALRLEMIERESIRHCNDIMDEALQKQFDLLLKDIVNEINVELNERRENLLNKIAEAIYFYDEKDLIEFETMNTSGSSLELFNNQLMSCENEQIHLKKVNSNENSSIFMNDLRSFLHECIYESTRLSLNVNRDLRDDIEEILILNEQKYLFRKWRIRTSLKLLHSGYKRASMVVQQQQQQINQIANENNEETSTNGSASDLNSAQYQQQHQQLQLLSFMTTYGNYLLKKMSRFQNITSLMLFGTIDPVNRSNMIQFNRNQLSFMEIITNNTQINCDQFLMHLTWNRNVNYGYVISDLLYDNFFDIIYNKNEAEVILPSPHYEMGSLSPTSNSLPSNLLVANRNHELFIKTVVAMPKFLDRNDPNSKEDVEALKRWLMCKLFKSVDGQASTYETQHIENMSINLLHNFNSYGIRHCIKLFNVGMTMQEYEKKLSRRAYFGSNSLIFVLMPFDCDDKNYANQFQSYLDHNQRYFLDTLRSFNENVSLRDLKPHELYEIMFISYLNDHNQTQYAIEFILSLSQGINESINRQNQISSFVIKEGFYSYCLLEGDVLKDNYTIQYALSCFMRNTLKKQSIQIHNTQPKDNGALMRRDLFYYEHINNLTSLSTLYDMTIMKFFQFLTHRRHCLNIAFDSLILEYNKRLKSLIDMLTCNDYLKIFWPIPELLDDQYRSQYEVMNKRFIWTAKYWNTKRNFEKLLRNDFYNLMKLNESYDLLGDDQVDFKQIELKLIDYLNNLIKSKAVYLVKSNEADDQQELVQIKSTIVSLIKNLKKASSANSQSPIVGSKKRMNQKSENDQDSKMKHVDWSQFLVPILKYLLTNGILLLEQYYEDNIVLKKKDSSTSNRNDFRVHLDEYMIYYNKNEMVAFDWIECKKRSNGATRSPLLEHNLITNQLSRQPSEDSFVRKYARENHFSKDKSNTCIFCNDSNSPLSSKLIQMKSTAAKLSNSNNLKRRASDENNFEDESVDEQSSLNNQSTTINSSMKNNNWSLMMNGTGTSVINTSTLTDLTSETDEQYSLTSPPLSFSSTVISPTNSLKQQSLGCFSYTKSHHQQQQQQQRSLTPIEDATTTKSSTVDEFEKTLQSFFNICNNEKSKLAQFQSKLDRELQLTSSTTSSRLKQPSSIELNNDTDNDRIKQKLFDSTTKNTFEEFFAKLNEEKSKNDKFNMKLSKMLNQM